METRGGVTGQGAQQRDRPSSGSSAEQWHLPPGPGYIILGRAVSPFAGAKQLGAL